MTALAKDRNTKFTVMGDLIDLDLAAAAQVFAGGVVSVNPAGFALAGGDIIGTVVRGVAQHAVDNTAGAAGDLHVQVRLGIAELENGPTPVDQADSGRAVYLLDDNTVSKVAGVANSILAGTLVKLDPDSGLPLVKLIEGAAVSAGSLSGSLPHFSNATRGASADSAAGTPIWNTDDQAPNYAAGANWHDSQGTIT